MSLGASGSAAPPLPSQEWETAAQGRDPQLRCRRRRASGGAHRSPVILAISSVPVDQAAPVLIIHVIRTNKIPFLQSRASVALMATTAGIMLVGIWLPSSPLGPALGLTPLPHLYWPLVALTLLAYVGLTQVVKAWLIHRRWI
jgi:hypothetical protein